MVFYEKHHFTVDASHAGEAKFAVRFIPSELVDLFIRILFNKEPVPVDVVKQVLEKLKLLYQLVVEMFQTMCSLKKVQDSELTSSLLKHQLTPLVSNLMENLFQVASVM
ncbi:hypothetical protein NPIL_673031 [Nephila pilipes]|uniref:Uncharacterized protein n=1 Tax=Nephila pilipes TaxID=299642 RepID=A0A8X6U6M0_NEPPI|nr:hypothetical protein NPIL_673031 [Nephila pilipes]